MDSFKTIQQGVQLSAVAAQSSAHADRVKKKREVIGALFSCMRLCVERGFSRRGHRDGGMETIVESDGEEDEAEDQEGEVVNLGNFKAIVRYSAVECQHPVLKNHLMHGAKNAMYFSASAQADMLASILKLTQHKVILEAKKQNGPFIYAVSADEVLDVGDDDDDGKVDDDDDDDDIDDGDCYDKADDDGVRVDDDD